MTDVVLCECFARDGLQHEVDFVPTERKRALIERFANLGFQAGRGHVLFQSEGRAAIRRCK